jgi:GH43 family beta-xylosidase
MVIVGYYNMMKRLYLIAFVAVMMHSCSFFETNTEKSTEQATFSNPILSDASKPWALFHDGFYYYMHGTHGMHDSIVLWKTKDISDLENAVKKTIWIPKDASRSQHIWGPEIHFIKGKWYVYYEADDGNTDNHQIYVIENSAKDPFVGEFVFKGHICTDKDNNWAIHPNVVELNDILYMTWSGWQSRRVVTEHQCIYIAKMKNPWTLDSERVLLSKPEFEWERQWINPDGSKTAYTIYVNESPQFFWNKNREKIYIFYSASGWWTPFYALGQLTADANSDLLDSTSWVKSKRPVFKQSQENNIYSTGNCSFIPSPDNKEYYLLYSARKIESEPVGALDSRSSRLQKIEWNEDGSPYFGVPVPEGVLLSKPSSIE